MTNKVVRNSPSPSPEMPRHNLLNGAHTDDTTFARHLQQSTTTTQTRPTQQQQQQQQHYKQQKRKQIEISVTPTTTDIIGLIVGDFGIWQLRTILIIFLCKIPAAWFMACIIFTAPELYAFEEYACDDSNLNDTQIVTDDQCYIKNFDEATSVATMERCKRFVYNSDFPSLIMEFDLICWRDIFIAWTQYWHLFGVLVGGVAGTKMMLFISPRNTYFIGMVAQIVCGVVTGYARDFSLHCAFRCLSAVCCAIMFTSGQAIFTDITGGVYRIGAVILYDTFWSIGVILLPGLGWFFNHWTYIYLGITFPTILLMLLLHWTPESPRWLLKNGNKSAIIRVEHMIRVAAEINERSFRIPDDFYQQLELLQEKLKTQPPAAGWLKLWRGKRAKLHMIGAHLALAAFIINFMGMLLNIRSFGRDYLVPNTIAMGFSEIIGCFLALHFTLKHDKWKWQWAGMFNIIAGIIGCLGWTFTNADAMDPELKVTLWMIIAVIPKAGVSFAQSMLFACMSELTTGNKKLPFVFSVVTWARIWLLTAPFINVLKRFDTALSLSAYCWLSIFGGICLCLLLTPRKTNDEIQMIQKIKSDSSLTAAVWTVESNVNNTHL